MPNRSIINNVLILLAALVLLAAPAFSQTNFRPGERVTYSISYNKVNDVAYAEIYTVSRGALSGRDAIELRSRFKKLNLVSVPFFEVDEARTTFVDPATGLPLFVSKIDDPEGIPRETTVDHTRTPAVQFDLLSVIYKVRHSAGAGTAQFQEGDRVYNVSFSVSGVENVKTPAGDFDTSAVVVQSEYLTELGITELRVNLTNDDARVPVLIRAKYGKKNEFRAEAASIQSIVPETVERPQPDLSPTPKPSPTPARTPEPYVDNLPLAEELAFSLGETLEYRITAAGRPVATVVMRARERRQIDAMDTLVLTATVTNAAPGNPLFALNDSITAFVDPVSLAPRRLEMKFAGTLSGLSQMVSFNDKTGVITYAGTNRVDAPVGTHSVLSLIYAMRSFNLKRSNVRDNPVNDTRVAVFWESQPYIFTLRPSPVEVIAFGEGQRAAQLIAVNTTNSQLDQLAIKVWLSNDAGRVPLRFSLGVYQADLASVSTIPVR